MGAWAYLQNLKPRRYQCGHCDCLVGSDSGYIKPAEIGEGAEYIYICTNCNCPTYFNDYGQSLPGVRFGSHVDHVPNEINSLYQEARSCTECSAYTASVLACRKLLMNVAVNLGAGEGLKFIEYVDYLVNNGHVTQSCRSWVDQIRRKGNEATHEIALMSENDSKSLLSFVEMLLKLLYDFPNRVTP